MLEEITAGIKLFFPFSIKLQLLFIKNMKIKVYEKGAVILEVGELSDKMYYVVKGFIRGYIMNNNGGKVTTWFKAEGTFFTSMTSYNQGLPSKIGLEAIEKTVTVCFQKDFIEKMIKNHIEVAHVYRQYIDIYFLILENSVIALQSQSAKQRYDYLLHNHPEILQRAPLGHVASYLGITQATLSRLRANRITNKRIVVIESYT
jgi:CRP/FNR family transcriptional regulator, anaerobic regulatory protein